MSKEIKLCTVRLPADLHRRAKLRAYEEDKSLQDWVIGVFTEELSKKVEESKAGILVSKGGTSIF